MAEQKQRPTRFQSPPQSLQKGRAQRTLSPAVKLRNSYQSLPDDAHDEVRQLRLQLAAVNTEIRDFRDKYASDVAQLKAELQTLRQEVDLVRFERDEAQARLSESTPSDMTLFARQIGAMRSDLDKLSSAYRLFQREAGRS